MTTVMWEYHLVENLAGKDHYQYIVNRGKEGWELVAIIPSQTSKFVKYSCYFKRKI